MKRLEEAMVPLWNLMNGTYRSRGGGFVLFICVVACIMLAGVTAAAAFRDVRFVEWAIVAMFVTATLGLAAPAAIETVRNSRAGRAAQKSLSGQRLVARYMTDPASEQILIEKVPVRAGMAGDEWTRWCAVRGRHNHPIRQDWAVLSQRDRIVDACEVWDIAWFGPHKPRPEEAAV